MALNSCCSHGDFHRSVLCDDQAGAIFQERVAHFTNKDVADLAKDLLPLVLSMQVRSQQLSKYQFKAFTDLQKERNWLVSKRTVVLWILDDVFDGLIGVHLCGMLQGSGGGIRSAGNTAGASATTSGAAHAQVDTASTNGHAAAAETLAAQEATATAHLQSPISSQPAEEVGNSHVFTAALII